MIKLYKEYQKEYNHKHKKEYQAYYQKNKERLLKYAEIYRQEHKEQRKQKNKEYILTPNSIYSIIEFRAKKLNTELSFTKIDFITWYNQQKQKCYYCDRTLAEIKQDIKENKRCKNRLSIDRKDNNKGYELNNIVLACYRCNTIKGDYFTEQEFLKIAKNLYNKGVKNE